MANLKLLKELKTENLSECRIEVGLPLQAHIEAVLFLAGDGVSTDFLAEKFGYKREIIEKELKALTNKYNKSSGIHLIKYRNNWQFSTNPDYAETVAEVMSQIREKNLTRAALETLAIIAYKQPITKTEIEEVRGSDSTYGIQILMQNNLVDVVGRKDTVGKPLLYATTDDFLKRFDLENIDNLPSYEELLEKIKIIQTETQELYER